MAEKRKIGSTVSDELRYAAVDIRRVWEEAWFGRAVTPSLMESAVTQSADPLGRVLRPESATEGQTFVRGRNPDVPGAIEGIGHAGGDDFHPDHTRDAVRDFYGLRAPRERLDDYLSPAGDDDDFGHRQRIDR